MPDFKAIASHFVARRIATESAFCGPILQRNTVEKLGESPEAPSVFDLVLLEI